MPGGFGNLEGVRRTFLFVLCALAGLTGFSGGRAGGVPWPWLAGSLRGVVTPVDGHALAWTATLASPSGGVRTGELVVTGEGVAVRIALELETVTGGLRWRVLAGEVDLAVWLPLLAAKFEATVLDGAAASGVLKLSGEGTYGDDRLGGRLQVEWQDGGVRHSADGWALEGISLRAGLEAADLLTADVPVELKVKTISTERFGARNLAISAAVHAFQTVNVQSTRVEIAGGEITAAPFAMTLAPPALSAVVTMSRVGLQDIVALIPTALSSARGRINGEVRLNWNEADGLRVGEGQLTLQDDEPTLLRLAASPGFLTAQVPARFVFLPAWTGPLVRWFSPVNPGYATLQDIELGKIDLRVHKLDVRLTPAGDEKGRTAHVSIQARPDQAGGLVEMVTFEINVSGPLASVLTLGMKQSFSLQIY